MGKTVEGCGVEETVSGGNIANAGINDNALIGYFKSLLWVDMDVKQTVTELKDVETLNALVAQGKAIYLGDGKFEDTSTEASYFEDTDLSIKIEQTEKIKSVKFTLNTCACVSAELEKLENKKGRLFVQTSKGVLVGRDEDGSGIGWGVSSVSVNDTIPTKDTPVEYTILDIVFDDYRGDRKNPLRINVDYLFSDIDEVFEGVIVKEGVVSSNGTNLTFDAKVKQGCSTADLTGVTSAEIKIIDEDGAEITTYTVAEAAGVYSFDVTTDKTKVYVGFDGVKTIGGVNYIGNNTTFSV